MPPVSSPECPPARRRRLSLAIHRDGGTSGILFGKKDQAPKQAIRGNDQEQQQAERDTFLRVDADQPEQVEIAAFAQSKAVQTDGQGGKRPDQGVDDQAIRKRQVDHERGCEDEMDPGLKKMNEKRQPDRVRQSAPFGIVGADGDPELNKDRMTSGGKDAPEDRQQQPAGDKA